MCVFVHIFRPHNNSSLNEMTDSDIGIPGEIEGFLSGCPFCTSNRLGIPEIGTDSGLFQAYL